MDDSFNPGYDDNEGNDSDESLSMILFFAGLILTVTGVVMACLGLGIVPLALGVLLSLFGWLGYKESASPGARKYAELNKILFLGSTVSCVLCCCLICAIVIIVPVISIVIDVSTQN